MPSRRARLQPCLNSRSRNHSSGRSRMNPLPCLLHYRSRNRSPDRNWRNLLHIQLVMSESRMRVRTGNFVLVFSLYCCSSFFSVVHVAVPWEWVGIASLAGTFLTKIFLQLSIGERDRETSCSFLALLLRFSILPIKFCCLTWETSIQQIHHFLAVC
jgi:hypothetical protein